MIYNSLTIIFIISLNLNSSKVQMYVHKSISNHWLFKDVIIHYLIKRLQARKSNHANVLTLQVLSSH